MTLNNQFPEPFYPFIRNLLCIHHIFRAATPSFPSYSVKNIFLRHEISNDHLNRVSFQRLKGRKLMLKCTIAGLGIQGVAIAYAMHQLGYFCQCIELNQETLDGSLRLLARLGIPAEAHHGDVLELLSSVIMSYEPDILISALPFHLNESLATGCIYSSIRYCDLGGNVDVANSINSLANEKATVPVITDLGLAPGMVNVIAELGFSVVGQAESVRIRVGGLPMNPEGTLKYGLTFSIQGLYNEYVEDCLVIRNGQKQTVKPLIDIEKIEFPPLGAVEAFNTSGGIASTLDSMLERGVRECDYKTIRFPGHAELIRFMLFECGMSREAFTDAISNACRFITDDQVLMVVDITSPHGIKWTRKFMVLHDKNFTAMQKTTGFGAAAVAAIMGKGLMDSVKAARYADVPLQKFRENVNRLIPEMDL